MHRSQAPKPEFDQLMSPNLVDNIIVITVDLLTVVVSIVCQLLVAAEGTEFLTLMYLTSKTLSSDFVIHCCSTPG
jgi:hypothetical protein